MLYSLCFYLCRSTSRQRIHDMRGADRVGVSRGDHRPTGCDDQVI